jgi:hypothetical protein
LDCDVMTSDIVTTSLEGEPLHNETDPLKESQRKEPVSPRYGGTGFFVCLTFRGGD